MNMNMNIYLEDNVEKVEFNGSIYKRYPNSSNKTDRKYFKRYVCNGKNSYLHRDVYEHYIGDIPEGCVIHHLDEDTSNNSIENLVCVTTWEHNSSHKKELAEKNRHILLANLKKGKPKVDAWRESEQGKEHYRKLGVLSAEKRPFKEYICKHCGKVFTSNGTKCIYCSKRCSSTALSRKRRSLDRHKEERVCEICGKTFKGNKYSKPRACSARCRAILRYKNK